MIKHFKKAAMAGAVALAFASGAQAVVITNGTITADVNMSGTFASLMYSGTEFIAHGTPLSYYWLNSGGSPFIADNASSTNPLGAITFGAGSFSFTASSGALTFNQTVSLVGSSAVVTVSLINTGSVAITGVQWGVGFDPDQGVPGTFDTTNSIGGQGGAASVTAADPFSPFKTVELRNTTDAGAFDIRAYIDTACCSPVDPASILAGAAQAVGAYGTADSSISLAYRIGTIAAGTTATIGYEYIFSTPAVPEPETYAMMLAGLGLMGFVARRRKQNLA